MRMLCEQSYCECIYVPGLGFTWNLRLKPETLPPSPLQFQFQIQFQVNPGPGTYIYIYIRQPFWGHTAVRPFCSIRLSLLSRHLVSSAICCSSDLSVLLVPCSVFSVLRLCLLCFSMLLLKLIKPQMQQIRVQKLTLRYIGHVYFIYIYIYLPIQSCAPCNLPPKVCSPL